MGYKRRSERLVRLFVLLLSSFLLSSASEGASSWKGLRSRGLVAEGGARQLQQRGAEEVEMTEENIGQLARLVRNAERDTVFVFTTDLQLPSEITVTQNRLTFRGNPDARPTLTCAEGEQGFEINANRVRLESLILRDCDQTAVLVYDANSGQFDPFNPDPVEAQSLEITIVNVDFVNNQGRAETSAAGGLSAGDKVRATVQSCTFEENSGTSGGAISFSGSSLVVEDCTFTNNEAVKTGGAIFAMRAFVVNEDSAEANRQLLISNSSFRGNHVLRGSRDPGGLTLSSSSDLEANPSLRFPLPSPSGGAVYVADFAEVRFERCRFTENHAVPAGGAVYLSDSNKILMERCRFENNYVLPPQNSRDAADLQVGGAVFAAFTDTRTELEFVSTDFVNNTAVYGGALHFVAPVEAVFRMNWCRFNDNVASLGGGAAVFRNAFSPLIANTRFVNNSAFVGGALLVANGGGLRLVDEDSDNRVSVFHNNVAFDGGAVFVIGGGQIMITKVVFRRNKAERNGGAICFIDMKTGGVLSITGGHMLSNSAERGGALFLENIARSVVIAAKEDRPRVLFGLEDNPRSNFFNNSAVAGGAIYYRGANPVENAFQVFQADFVENTAHADISSVHPEPLNYPRVAEDDSGRRRLFQLEEEIQEEDSMLLDLRSANPCHPGGGGAMCLVLSGISNRAPVSVEIARCNFTRNAAVAAGAMLISTEPDVEWESRCPPITGSTASLLTSDPCRNLNLRGLSFRRNQAQHAGGAILASNLHHVHFSTAVRDDVDVNYQTLDRVATGPHFFKNRVVGPGYGDNVAGMAVRLSISSPTRYVNTGLLVANQPSGQSNKLPQIKLQVLDGLDQVVSGGIVDASLRVSVDVKNPATGDSIATGQVIASAEEGVATFKSLSLSAPAGEYDVVFAVGGSDIKADSGVVALRECLLGERNNKNDFVCETCVPETFTFQTNATRCEDCPDTAVCYGGASLVPRSGHWHSSPFSVLIHECFHSDACSYRNRSSELRQQRHQNLTEFLTRFDQDDSPVFTNDEYSQCSPGYEGPLCGSCQDGYGHADGKSCAKCVDKAVTAVVILLLAVWQLVFLAITIRSAVVSSRDMNQMLAITQQQVSALSRSTQRRSRRLRGGGRFPSAFMVLHQDSTLSQTAAVSRPSTATVPGVTRTMTGNEVEAQIPTDISPTSPSNSQSAPKQQLSADYIIAAQHVSETIKIFVNFFQVTSVAVNIKLEWTAAIKNMLAGMNSVAGFSNGAMFTPITCLLDSDSDLRSIHGVVLHIAFPLCLMVLVMCVFVIQWFFMRRAPNVTRAACQHFLRSRTIIVFLVVGFFSYQSISEDLMGTVSCIQIDEKDMSDARNVDKAAGVSYSHFSIARDRYWTEDTNIECLSRNHAFLVGFLGIPGIVLFLCGVPLYLLIFLLYKRHQRQLLQLNVLNTYGFIYQNYEDKFVYWEVCILVRKALIGAVVVFAYPLGANLQGVMALGILILSLIFHMIATPFKYLPLNVLEGCSLVVSIFTFYAGIVFNDENTSDSAIVFLSMVVIFTNALLVAVILSTVFVYGNKCVVAKLKVFDVASIPKNPLRRALLLVSVLGERVGHYVIESVHQTLTRSASRRTTRLSKNTQMAPQSLTIESQQQFPTDIAMDVMEADDSRDDSRGPHFSNSRELANKYQEGQT